MFTRKRASILFYWSIRYVAILFAAMLVVWIIFIISIYIHTERNQKERMGFMINDIVAAAAEQNGKLPEGLKLQRWLNDHSDKYGLFDRAIVIIYDQSGNVVQAFPQPLPIKQQALNLRQAEMMSGNRQFHSFESNQQKPLLAVSEAIVQQGETIGYAMYAVRKEGVLKDYLPVNFLRMAGWMTVMVCGWAVIYLITRRLVKPIQEVSAAAKQVVEGNYELNIDKTYKEREIDDLMTSFKEMAEQLRQMEQLRSQLLAGVTHELKTPITAISGLAQAVHDKVVVDEEADEFLKYCIIECNRLKTMVDDLLDFNRFAANTIEVTMKSYSLKDAIYNTVEIWQLGQEQTSFELDVNIVGKNDRWTIITDIERLKQIIINLLNNARDAIEQHGVITVRLTSEEDHFLIAVEDTGKGIPEDEQQHIFEPFYRGTGKKNKIRGLGMGLAFSRLIAHSLGGQLLLTKSSSEGTVFSLCLPKSLAKK